MQLLFRCDRVFFKLCLVFFQSKGHWNAAGLSSWRACKGWVKTFTSHVRLLSETMCFQNGGCVLIAELCVYAYAIQTGFCIICVLYRSWVPDEDLGMSVGELICWDLEIGHQHLHSFPMGSQKGHTSHTMRTWHFKWPQTTQKQYTSRTNISITGMRTEEKLWSF